MNVRLRSLLAQAESLPEDQQDALADLVDSFLAGDDDLLTPEELEELRRIDREAFVPADPADVAAYFARRG